MVKVTKNNPNLTLSKNESGQISIFFSASLVVLITIIAFVINVGLFVKAKINLQNATDAAAYSGAAVQSRQLTKIAYLNWEMRNVYKEWMYKYYVVGNLNINDVEDPSGDGAMSFRLEPDIDVLDLNRRADDQYNIPATCIHIANTQTNICKKYAIPGLPEFGNSFLVGAEEASRSFVDQLIATKVRDCIDRSKLNMFVATTWAYNVITDDDPAQTLVGKAPAILADRPGAWPKAIEIAMRIRNLEKAVNKLPNEQSVCNQNSGRTNCGQTIADFISSGKDLGNERLVKAFYSGYRNIGNNSDNEMKESFTLTEIKPRILENNSSTNASNFLIPTPYPKPYLDLKLMMVNYAVFYAAMIPRTSAATGQDFGDRSGGCDVSKVAIPVPGYPLGYYKNPDVLTYYAVKGQAEFLGMFNPFGGDPIKLTAYAAAKPFGGRIGPMLFVQRSNNDAIKGRSDSKRSIPYISGLDLVGALVKNPLQGQPTELKDGDYTPGAPLPINFRLGDPPGPFWLKDSDSSIGGKIGSADAIQFGIPNLVYDYESGFTNSGYTFGSDKINILKASADPGTDKTVGLFSKKQFSNFKGSAFSPGEVVTPNDMVAEIARVRAATTYESANYLTPSPDRFNAQNNLDSFGQFPGNSPTQVLNGTEIYEGNIYAPLFSSDQTDVLYTSAQQVITTITDFMRLQQQGIFKYRDSLNMAALTILNQKNFLSNDAQGSALGYEKAAKGVSDIDFSNPTPAAVKGQSPKSCDSLSGQFLFFYYGAPDTVGDLNLPADFDNSACPIPLGLMLETFFSSTARDPTFSTHYKMELSWREPQNGIKSFSAYAPGPLTGIDVSGSFTNPVSGSQTAPELMRRNTYSTKFITLRSVMEADGQYAQNKSNFPLYSEGSLNSSAGDALQEIFSNPIDASFNGELSTIKH